MNDEKPQGNPPQPQQPAPGTKRPKPFGTEYIEKGDKSPKEQR